MSQQRRIVTLESVAQHAGVSMKTASNAVNGTGRMAVETRSRVLAVIDELGYRPNVAARNLTTGRTGAVSFAVPTLKAAYLAELAEAFVETARSLDLVAYISTYPDDGVGGCREFLRRHNPQLADGLVITLPEFERLEERDFDVDFPLVCLGTRSTYGRAELVTTDDVSDARTATEYLLARGSTSIAVVGARSPFDGTTIARADEGNAELRLRGVQEALRAAGRPLDPRLVGVTGQDWTIGSGFRAARDTIAAGVPFDGLVALNDGLAIGAISALREHGLRVPDDVQVIGFDNIEESAYLAPPLTTMDSRIDWIARTALERLLARIARPAEPVVNAFARTQLIARGTTR
jgi:DNA-binding LacI/PurR family transcriptional regulator